VSEPVKRHHVIGAGLTALYAASLVGVVGAAYYLNTVNTGEAAMVQAPARAYVEALAQKVQSDPSPPAAAQSLALIKKSGKHVKQLMVIVEPASTKYRFLRKRRFLAHPQKKLVGKVLDKRQKADKQLYDICSRVRSKKKTVIEIKSPMGKPLTVRAAAPIMRDNKHWATAIVVTQPVKKAEPLPAWPIMASVIICILLALIAGGLASRMRYVLVIFFTAGVAAFTWWWLHGLVGGYQLELSAQLKGLSDALGGGTAAPTKFPNFSIALIIATTVAIGIGVLGQLRVGARIVSSVREHRLAYTLLLPAGLGMLMLVLLPFAYGLGLGFFNHAHGQYTFVGLDNFVEILSGGDKPLSHPLNFYFTLGVTILWTSLNVFLHVAIGLGLALLLKDPLLKFKGIYRALLILPWAMPNYITALIWKGMFHYQYGAVNHVLESMGLDKVSWFSSFWTAFMANVVTNTWLGFPFMMVVSLGALQSIPSEVYEAAAVDGAPKWRSFLHITLPLLRPALYPAIVLGSIWTFNMFNIIYLVSGGEPGGSTDILITEAYRWAFQRGDRYGLAAAYALLIFVILWGYSKVANRLARVSED
jgi:ABC-type sugar transport system permease subunit